jgi:hypothetical protein
MKTVSFVIFISLIFTLNSYGQNDDSLKTEFLKHAPPRVKEYYHVFDSLAHPTWHKWVQETWTDAEVKRYASLIFTADDYDPIARKKFDRTRHKTAKDANHKYIINDFQVEDEIEKRISKKYAHLIHEPYWLTIVIENIEKVPYPVSDVPHLKLTDNKIYGKVIKIWKGKTFKVGDIVTCFYCKEWGYHDLKRGHTYIIALYPILENMTGEYSLALGGPNHVQRSVFPIENNYVRDEDNIFDLGIKVNYQDFVDNLTAKMNEIKSWKDGGR